MMEAAARQRGLPIGNLTSQLWGNSYLDPLDHAITEGQAHGAYLRYTDDFLIFAGDKARLWELHAVVITELAKLRLKLALPKSQMMDCAEGVPFCGFVFHPGLQPRVLGTTKRRFEARRYRLFREGVRGAELTASVFSWYQFSREGNTTGLRRAYLRWPLDPRLKRRRSHTPGAAGCLFQQQRPRQSALLQPQSQHARQSQQQQQRVILRKASGSAKRLRIGDAAIAAGSPVCDGGAVSVAPRRPALTICQMHGGEVPAAPAPRPPCRESGNFHAKPFCGARGTRAIHLTCAPVPWAVATHQGQDAAGGVAGRCSTSIEGRPAEGLWEGGRL